MPLINRRKNESLWRRVWRACRSVPDQPGMLSSEGFRFELAREISRSNRRRQDREFALIHLASDKPLNNATLTTALVDDLHQRMRLSDSLGWHSSHVAVLLPETGREGASLVANELERIARKHGRLVESHVYIYPWDDELIAISNDIASDSDSRANQPPTGDHVESLDVSSNGFDTRTDDRHETNGHLPAAGENGVQAMTAFEHTTGGTATGTLTVPESEVATSRSIVRQAELSDPLASVEKTRIADSVATPLSKRAIDVVGAGLGLLVLSPLFLVSALAIKITSPGPVFFRQDREGKDGKPFGILKFRTMVIDAEAQQDSLRSHSEQDGPAFKIKDDPRITRTGRYLRKSCIDELPQLVNVLLGQMSLVGPRPLPVGESHGCKSWQRLRLTVLPGLTCTWQVRGGRKVSFDQWMRMDLDYIQRRSFLYDLRLLVETALVVLMHRGSV